MPASLDPHNPYQPFPDIRMALAEPNGLLAVGGCLSPVRLLNAYRHGIFPWYGNDDPILWWSPDPRWVIHPEDYKPARSLAKQMRRGDFSFSHDRAFEHVLQGCAAPRPGVAGTWITPEMQAAYQELYRKGFAHSFEAWQGGKLMGGLYGVTLGRAFFGESMFHRVSNASKAVFAYAMTCLAAWGYKLVDCQVYSAHLESLGAEAISRTDFAGKLYVACRHEPLASAWEQESGA
ncbi:leucyl/phenylalanyl-tRNA--protein transferase [Candidatus Methylospira mobilis]|uniref:Leucyl/phenylalanyl-tRNA--protein transferase n=1 Tax=Candidatus Methylospira mobilis TaxID=1808979 RepID=A0A5Q0BGE5_9GAMM|nr:leucyl/phenylalanyl-tRNA--protein transferase [Candidatus Methylospira mobilis]QFY42880.1 leucyl/phenylalanyl-tRNA--protein transferase [Candidatus Methylospira mobilis]WNV04061.1 leucyl/phenylalanyl-tRNA--protein transferase [Candidatus Methylospira mobilis]